jgi:hypothetical protein
MTEKGDGVEVGDLREWSSIGHRNIGIGDLLKDFTPPTKITQTKIYPASRELSLNQDKNTYTCGEQEQLIEFSSFNMCSILQS